MIRKSMRPGGGGRFELLVHKLAARGVKNPRALAAWIGRKNYGKRKMAEWAAAGRRRAAAARRRAAAAHASTS